MNEDNDPRLNALIRTSATRYRATPSLESAIRTEIALHSVKESKPLLPGHGRFPKWGFAGAGFACGVLVSAIVVLATGQSNNSGDLEEELTSSHVRALMANHLTDVASSDQHTVKPWFQGKLDFSPPVRNLSEEGFPLVGGRLDYAAGRPVAALVYRRHDHMINVFVWPASGPEHRSEGVRQGYHIRQWRSGGMQFAAVSDLNVNELETLGKLLH